ncbi:uncharacterized protein LOC141664202 isoform X2 [Apium graveolens]|uniref:uncharacterized protein LOC141664202 isoform X2 n=1 Tax=Apium graveolens TaxID=4045 RepID=UPI003D7AA989
MAVRVYWDGNLMVVVVKLINKRGTPELWSLILSIFTKVLRVCKGVFWETEFQFTSSLQPGSSSDGSLQSANSKRLETMAEELQSKSEISPASSGEHWSAKKNNAEKVNNCSGKKRGRPKKHIGERSTGANVDMNDSRVGDEIPKIGDFHPSGEDLILPPLSCRKQPRNGVNKHNGMLRKTEKTPTLEGQEDVTQYQGDIPDLNQCDELNDEGGEVGTAAIVSTDSMENEDGGDVGTAALVRTDSTENEEDIPFVKRSTLWESICSGKAYMKMKRKPHFQPLEEQEEVLREGSAIGLVVSFNNLVESASKLQPSSDISAIESILKTLDTFKPHGFDVDRVEEALAQLKLKKQKLEDLQKDYMEKESKILKIVEEGKLGDEEISQLRQKLSEAELKKENREKTSSALLSERAADAENIQSMNAEYEKIVGSIL